MSGVYNTGGSGFTPLVYGAGPLTMNPRGNNALSLGKESLTIKQQSTVALSPQLSPSNAGSVQQGFGPSSNYGSRLVVDAFKEGALSSAQDRENLNKIKSVLNEAVDSIIAQRKTIDLAIQEFYTQSKTFNATCAHYALAISKQIVDGNNLSEDQVTHMNFLMQLAAQIGNRFFETTNQLLTLQKLNSEQKLADYKSVINLIFFSRLEELNLLKERLLVVQKQSNFELELAIAAQNQALKAESQAFDQAFKVAEFNAKEDQSQFERELEARKQTHQEEQDLILLALKRQELEGKQKLGKMEVVGKQKIEDAKVHNEQAIAQAQLKSQHKIAMTHIKTEERVKWGKMISDTLKPQCRIM